jgi:hypothetical protein
MARSTSARSTASGVFSSWLASAEAAEGVLEARQHGVQRGAQPREFVIAAVPREPPVQAAPVGDVLDFVDQIVDRAERPASDIVGQDEREEHDDGRHDEHRAQQEARGQVRHVRRDPRYDACHVRADAQVSTRGEHQTTVGTVRAATPVLPSQAQHPATHLGAHIRSRRQEALLIQRSQRPHADRDVQDFVCGVEHREIARLPVEPVRNFGRQPNATEAGAERVDDGREHGEDVSLGPRSAHAGQHAVGDLPGLTEQLAGGIGASRGQQRHREHDHRPEQDGGEGEGEARAGARHPRISP